MSKASTSTLQRTKTNLGRTSSILLSPSKRGRAGTSTAHDASMKTPTPAEILKWTFNRASTASCFVSDVLNMKDSGSRDMEFFWLGRIPCRTVRIVGLVVGIQVQEKRTMYIIDDGTAVIECGLAHPQPAPRSPGKHKSVKTAGASAKRPAPSSAKASFSDYVRAPDPPKPVLPLPPPVPVIHVGLSVRVEGRVIKWRDTRIVLVNEIHECPSSNGESEHWMAVSRLHRDAYYPTKPMPPFVPPPPTLPELPCSPSKQVVPSGPHTPSHYSVASPTNTTPTTIAASSPASNVSDEHQVPRLRHPSRLHTRDLTTNTFRIYVKHYMDHAPPPPRRRRFSGSRSESPTPTPRSSKRPRYESDVDATPRPSRRLKAHKENTATPARSLLPDPDTDAESEAESESDDDEVYGFTLSHLRRVPELALLSRRVVKAEARRRAKENHHKEKEKSQRSQAKPVPPISGSSRSAPPSDPPIAAAVKRLFKQAIRTLFTDGDIVLWEGPVRPLPLQLSLVPSASLPLSSGLWKTHSSTLSSISAASSRSRPVYDEWDEDEPLSDPPPHEEAYIPLTSMYFARVLESAIRTIMDAATAPALGCYADERTPTKKCARRQPISLIEKLRAEERTGTGVLAGPTKGELLVWLRNSDERWARVGEWAVEEALKWGEKEGRLWCVGRDRWEVCG
ncbi:uncharacterized protein BXZ73DRAFT_41804 [Epithele typhae]|uniref:uncharacterized protein n=1 Tax=Epithele typhae TaxID=378194 RepID=UPI00200894A0|nr:uncharacterized protein BXZ73DRAFT_41804 [Epithele typhae]KAH9941773.1 hypothetical protein BXZ73DRAFT_41804 [Epithele typhae]